MSSTLSSWLGLALGSVASQVLAGTADVWLTTKARVALLAADGIALTAIAVDAADGTVTLRGRVKTESEKEKATLVVTMVDGVRSVKNLLQVAPEVFRAAKASDDAVN